MGSIQYMWVVYRGMQAVYSICGWYTEVCRQYRVVYRNVERYAQMTMIMYIASSDCVHIVGIATVRRLCGAMVARLTPEQKVACSSVFIWYIVWTKEKD